MIYLVCLRTTPSEFRGNAVHVEVRFAPNTSRAYRPVPTRISCAWNPGKLSTRQNRRECVQFVRVQPSGRYKLTFLRQDHICLTTIDFYSGGRLESNSRKRRTGLTTNGTTAHTAGCMAPPIARLFDLRRIHIQQL